jgi:hypothetical protein
MHFISHPLALAFESQARSILFRKKPVVFRRSGSFFVRAKILSFLLCEFVQIEFVGKWLGFWGY